jgi:Peptidase of plants and bacteria
MQPGSGWLGRRQDWYRAFGVASLTVAFFVGGYSALADLSAGAAVAAITKSTTSANNPNADCAGIDSAGSAAYASQLDGIEKDITSHLGGTFPDPVYLEVNTVNVASNPTDTNSLLYTAGCFKGAIPTSGPVDSCTVHIQPRSLHGKGALSTSDIHASLIHEMMHCYLFQKYGAATYGFPAWFDEGASDWVANAIAGSHVVDGHWEDYLEHPNVALWTRTYDGIGFFVHLAESGTNPWHAILPMAAALVASSDSSPSAWSAAAPTTSFLDNWGAGFAQGRYPGTPWNSTGHGLPRYPAPLPSPVGVKDLVPVAVSSVPAGTMIQPLDVDSQVVHVAASGGSYGRISLGAGKDNTLAQSQGVNYCTDGSGCHCPTSSPENGARFTHMADGPEFVTVTGGTATGAITIEGESLKDFCAPDCVVGTWRVTNQTVTPLNVSGGAGATLILTKNGVATLNHDGSQPLVGTGLSITYAGQETERVTLPTDPTATSGTWTWTVESGDVSATTTEFGYTHSGALAEAFGYAATGSWTCRGNAMTTTVSVSAPGGRPGVGGVFGAGGRGSVTVSYTLTRVSH